MIVLDYAPKYHKQIIHACVKALRQGKTVVYPTDTSYGMAVNTEANNFANRLAQVKGHKPDKHISVVVPSLAYVKKIVQWNKTAQCLAKAFWPGALTIVLPLKNKRDTLGLRLPKNNIALDLVKGLNRPITATSANRHGQPDCYSLADILKQYKNQKHKPDIIINAGPLVKRKPSTLVKITNGEVEILRRGPITKKQILNVL